MEKIEVDEKKNNEESKIVTVTKESKRENQCFVIMPISDQHGYPEGHFQHVYEQIFKPAIEEAGYEPYRVDENKICDNIIDKIFDAIQNCPMAICDLSSCNPNVLYELGLRQAYDKPVVLIKDEKSKRIFDVSGINTVEYNSNRLYENVIDARGNIAEAIRATKDGMSQSIVKVVKAKKADYDSVTVSADDKTEIMFNTIMGKIDSLQSDSYFSRGQNATTKENERKYYGRMIEELHRMEIMWEDLRARLNEDTISTNEKIQLIDEFIMKFYYRSASSDNSEIFSYLKKAKRIKMKLLEEKHNSVSYTVEDLTSV